MKNYKKAILASLATIGASCALIGGATFALFTSDSTTNIAVTSGKVDVQAEVLTDTIELYSMGTKMDETFANGGTANYDEDTNKFDINGMVAGDYIKFDVKIVNYSTVAVKYQSVVSFEGDADLFKALDLTMGEFEFVGMSDTFYTNWATLEKGEEGYTMHASIGIPEEYEDKIVNGNDTNSIQGKECEVIFNVAAVQGNANVYDPVAPNPEWDGENIEDVADIMAFRDAVNGGDTYKGKTVTLKADLDLGGIANWEPIAKEVSFQGTFEGDNHTVSNLTVNYPEQDYVGLFGHLNGTVNALNVKNANVAGKYSAAVIAGTIFNYGTISNVKVEAAVVSGNHWVGGIVGYAYGNVTGCTVDGLEITCTPDLDGDKYDNGDKVGGIVGYVGEGSYIVSGNKVSNATITAYRDLAGIAGYSQVLVTDNTVENVTLVVDRTLADEYVSVKDINLVDYITSNGKHDGTNTVTESTIKYVNCGDYFVDKNGVFHVSTAAGLNTFRDKVNAWKANGNPNPEIQKNFANQTVVLESNIDLGGKAWYPIGLAASTGDVSFGGIFDGNGYTISNFKIEKIGANDLANDHYGFFGTVNGNNAVIKNVTFADVTINFECDETYMKSNQEVAHPHYIGVVAGRVGSSGTPTLENITIKGNVKIDSDHDYVGAVVGHMGANASNITVDVNAGSYVKGVYEVGGIAGATRANGGSYTKLTTNIDVIGKGEVGGLVGWEQSAAVYKDCTATGNLTATLEEGNVNAAFGTNYNAGTVLEGFTFKGTIEGGTFVGFFAANSATATLTNCIATVTRNGATTEYKSSDLL